MTLRLVTFANSLKKTSEGKTAVLGKHYHHHRRAKFDWANVWCADIFFWGGGNFLAWQHYSSADCNYIFGWLLNDCTSWIFLLFWLYALWRIVSTLATWQIGMFNFVSYWPNFFLYHAGIWADRWADLQFCDFATWRLSSLTFWQRRHLVSSRVETWRFGAWTVGQIVFILTSYWPTFFGGVTSLRAATAVCRIDFWILVTCGSRFRQWTSGTWRSASQFGLCQLSNSVFCVLICLIDRL